MNNNTANVAGATYRFWRIRGQEERVSMDYVAQRHDR